jgi:hypothetical protein
MKALGILALWASVLYASPTAGQADAPALPACAVRKRNVSWSAAAPLTDMIFAGAVRRVRNRVRNRELDLRR